MAKKLNIGELIAGGFAGAALGSILSDKPKNQMISAVLGAAVSATYQASQNAKAKRYPVLFEENGYLYRRDANGSVMKLKKLDVASKKYENEFFLD